MEEKERYSFEYADDGFDINDDELVYIFDNKNNKDIVICAYMDYKQGKDLCDLLNQQDKRIKELEDKLTDSEKQIKDAKETVNISVDSWCKNRRKYEAQIAEMQNKSFILYSMLYETLEKQGCDNVASQIDQMTGWTYDKEVNWLKGNRNYDQLKQSQKQLAISELETLAKFSEENAYYYEEQQFAKQINIYISEKIKSLKGEE